jgi:hypothetical protein
MLMVNQLTGFGAGGGPVGPIDITRTADPSGVSSSSNVATYSGVSIGAADEWRIIVVTVTAELASASPNSATINSGGGAETMSATTIANETDVYSRIFYHRVPSGTTADIAVTFGAGVSSTENHITVYRVTGVKITPAFSGANSSTATNSTPVTTGSITIKDGGGVIAVMGCNFDLFSITWTNATKDVDIDAGGQRHSTATHTTSGTVTITASSPGSSSDGALSWIGFDPP